MVFFMLSVSNAQTETPVSSEKILMDAHKFVQLSENAGYVVAIGTFNAHLTENLNVTPGRYTFLCTGFLISNPELASLDVSLLVTAISCNGELKSNDSANPYYFIAGPLLFDLDKSIKHRSDFTSFRVKYEDFTRDPNNDLMYLVLPNSLKIPEKNEEIDAEDIKQIAAVWKLPSTKLDISNELEVGEKVTLIGYTNLKGPESYTCVYLGKGLIYSGPYLQPYKHTIGSQLFCDGLVSTEINLHGLGGSPILKNDLTSVVGFVATYSIEEIFYEMSTGATISDRATNGLVNFVSLVGAKVKTENGRFSKLEVVGYEDGIFETSVLNPKTGNLEDLKIPMTDNYIHGAVYFRDDIGRVTSYEKYENGELADWVDLDLAMYDFFENQTIYLTKSVDDENMAFIPLNKAGNDIIIPLMYFESDDINYDLIKKGDIIRVPFDDNGMEDWYSFVIDEELTKLWFEN